MQSVPPAGGLLLWIGGRPSYVHPDVHWTAQPANTAWIIYYYSTPALTVGEGYHFRPSVIPAFLYNSTKTFYYLQLQFPMIGNKKYDMILCVFIISCVSVCDMMLPSKSVLSLPNIKQFRLHTSAWHWSSSRPFQFRGANLQSVPTHRCWLSLAPTRNGPCQMRLR